MNAYPSNNPHGFNLLPFVTNPQTGQPCRYQVITPTLKYGTGKRGRAIKAYRDGLKSGRVGTFLVYDTTQNQYLEITER